MSLGLNKIFLGLHANPKLSASGGAEITVTGFQPATSALVVGQSIDDTPNWSNFVSTSNYATSAGGETIVSAVPDFSAASVSDATTALSDGDTNQFSIIVTDSAGNERVFGTSARTVVNTAPTVTDSLDNQTLRQGTGTVTFDPTGVFTGADIVWSLGAFVAGVSINDSTGLISYDRSQVTLGNKSIVVRATNSGGVASAGYTLTVQEELVLPTVSGLTAHFDGADASTVVLDGNNVTSWVNKFAGGGNLGQTNASLRPTYGQRTLNGVPGVEFQGGQRLGRGDAFGFTGNAAFTVFIVRENDANTQTIQTLFYMGKSTNSTNGQAFYLSDGSAGLAARYNNGNKITSASTTGTGQIVSVLREEDDGYLDVGIRINGGNEEAQTSGADANDTGLNLTDDSFILGSNRNSAGEISTTTTLDGVVYELIIYDRALLSNEFDLISEYLAEKYNLNNSPKLPADVLVTFSEQDNEIDFDLPPSLTGPVQFVITEPASVAGTYSVRADNGQSILAEDVRSGAVPIRTNSITGNKGFNSVITFNQALWLYDHDPDNPPADPVYSLRRDGVEFSEGQDTLTLGYDDLSGRVFTMVETFMGVTITSDDFVTDPCLPTDGGNLLGWYDASDTSTLVLSGSDVTQWNDKSANSNNIAQTNAARRPTSGGTINGLNVVNFDGGTNIQFLERDDALGRTGNAGLTMVVIGRTNSIPEGIHGFAYLGAASSTAGRGITFATGSAGISTRMNNGFKAWNSANLNVMESHVWTKRNVDQYEDTHYYNDGGYEEAQTGISNGSNTVDLQNEKFTLGVGLLANGTPSGFSLYGDIGEVFIFNQEINFDRMNALLRAAENKWDTSHTEIEVEPV